MVKRTTKEDIENWFEYHPPKGTQPDRYRILNGEFKRLAFIILDLTPSSADQTVVFRRLRECRMLANATIACNEPSE